MASSNYPPGHPTGTVQSIGTGICPECEATITVHHEYERETNAHSIDDAYCDECEYELTDDDLDGFEFDYS